MKYWFCLLLTILVLTKGLSDPKSVTAQEAKKGDLYEQAQALAHEGKLAEAEEPLNSLLARENNQIAQLLTFRASLRAQSGRFQDAIGDMEQAIQIDPSNHAPWFTISSLLVQTGDTAQYRKYCKEMLHRFNDTTDAPIANRIAKSCMLMPSALDSEDVAMAAKLADKSVALTTDGGFWPWRNMTAGLAEYRRGEFARASEMIDRFQKELNEAERSNGLSGDWSTCKADACFISAMAHHKLKETDQAKAAFDQGREIVRTKLPALDSKDLGQSWWDVLMAYILIELLENLCIILYYIILYYINCIVLLVISKRLINISIFVFDKNENLG